GLNLNAARAAGLKNNLRSVWRPVRKLRPSAVVSQLHPLLARDIHQIDILRSWSVRAIVPNPGKNQEWPIWGPGGGHSIALIRDLLGVTAVGFHDVDLRQACAAANP